MMPTYRGNVGNLLQHWTLCELVTSANPYWSSLRFVDAYAMAPLATERPKSHWSTGIFDHARDRAPGRSIYEQAWAKLAPDKEYPNSAAFVAELWLGAYSMVLCELDEQTVRELRSWKESSENEERCRGIEVADGDWRQRFRSAVADDSDLLFISFDPDMFSCSDTSHNGRNVSPSDFAKVVRMLPAGGSVLIQLSTYSANGGNSQSKVESSVKGCLGDSGLEVLACVKVDGQMMSIVLGRSCPAAMVGEVRAMPKRFNAWLEPIRFAVQRSTAPGPTAGRKSMPSLPRLKPRPPH